MRFQNAYHDSSCSLQSKRQRRHIQKQQVLDLLTSLSAENSCLHCCAIGNSLIWVDGLAELLSIEEVLKHLLHLGDTGGASNKDHFVHLHR